MTTDPPSPRTDDSASSGKSGPAPRPSGVKQDLREIGAGIVRMWWRFFDWLAVVSWKKLLLVSLLALIVGGILKQPHPVFLLIIASIIMLGFGLWWLARAEASARKKGEGYGTDADLAVDAPENQIVRERATTSGTFDPAEVRRGHQSDAAPSIALAAFPLAIVVGVNLLMSLFVLPRLDASYLADLAWGSTSLSAVAGVWAVVTALATAIVTLIAINYRRLPALRASMDAGANASALPVLTVASLVGFGAVVAALPAFATVRDWVLSIDGGPLVSLAVATNVLASLTGSASGGLTIALDALGDAYMRLAAAQGIDPALMHRVAVISAGTLDSLPHNGAVVTLLAVCGSTHRESYLDIVMVAIVGALLGLVAVIGLGTAFGSF